MSVERRRMRRVQHDEIGMQIAPMIDVTLLLLFFSCFPASSPRIPNFSILTFRRLHREKFLKRWEIATSLISMKMANSSREINRSPPKS